MYNKYFKLIDLFIENDDVSRNNANFVRGIPVLEHVVVGEVMKDYLFDVIYKGLPVRTHHEEGWAYHHQTYRLSAYSYSPVNQLVIKRNGKVQILSFEEFYEGAPGEEILLDEENEVYQKDLSSEEIYVLDRNGWTKVTKVTKKRRQKGISVVKTRMGEIFEVTNDHPCIVGEDFNREVKPAEKLTPFEDKQFRVNSAKELKKFAFKVKRVDVAKLLKGETGLVIAEDFVILKPAETVALHGMKRNVELNEDLGYFVGFFLAEGSVKNYSGAPSQIAIFQKDRKTLEKLQKILFNTCGVYSAIYRHNTGYYLSVPNRTFLSFLNNFVSVGERAYRKRLSPDILKYSKEFIKGIVAGLLDGDGTLNTYGQISLRISSPELIYQLSYILQLLGYHPAMRYEECKNTENRYGIKQRRPLYGIQFTYREGLEELKSEKFKAAKRWKEKEGVGDQNFYKTDDWVSVQSVREIENQLTLNRYEYVYDITTESQTFVLHNIWVHNCIGLSAKDIAYHGLQSNAKNERRAAPPKRLETLFMQCANLICLIAQEVSGATSLNDLSTVAAGYLYYLEKEGKKSYSDYDLENLWQEFLYNINLPFRSGNSPFSNITLDFGKPNSRLKHEPVVYAGKLLDFTYSQIPAYYFDRINTAFIKAMRRGDADGNPFTFPLITVNITEDFDRNNPAWKLLLKESEYFGGFYVQNYLKEPFEKPSIYKEKNPYIKPFDEGMIYSNCCLSPETELFVFLNRRETPEWLSLEEIKQNFAKEVIAEGSSEKWWRVEGVEVPSVNPKTGKVERKRVTKLLEVKSNREVKIRFRNGFEISCDPTHRVAIFSNGKISWKPAGEVKPGDLGLCLKKPINRSDKLTKLTDGTELNEEIAWFLGYFYAEGCFVKDYRNKQKKNGIVLTAGLNEKDKLEKARRIANKYFGHLISSSKIYLKKWNGRNSSYQLWIYGRRFAEFLLENGVIKYKKLPEAIKKSPSSVVRAFLQGFIEGNGYNRNGHTELHVNDEPLIRELSALMWLHGIRHTLRIRKNSQTLKLSKPIRSSCYSLVPAELIEEKSVITPSGNRSYIKTPTVSWDFVEKYSFESEKLEEYRNWDIEILKVESVEEITLDAPKTFLDVEVEDNETFILANGIVSFNCRMLFDISQVEAVTGSNPFHSGSGVGGIGVYAINMNRLLFLAKDDFDLLKRMIDYTMEVGARALQKKREWLKKHWNDLFPYLSFYQKDDRSLFNIFSVVGVHEGMVNAGFKGGLFNDEAKDYAHAIAQYLYEKLHYFMERDRVLYSLEYAPSENAACKMAQKDLSFAKALAEVLEGKRDVNISRDEQLNMFIRESVEKFGERIFELVEVEDEG